MHRDGMRAAKDAPCGPRRLLERRHGLAEVVERGAVVPVERHRVIPPHSERTRPPCANEEPVAAPAPATAQTTNQSTNVNGVNLGDSWTLQEHVDTGQGQ